MRQTAGARAVLILAAVLSLSTCDSFSLFGELDSLLTGGLAILPSSTIVNVDASYGFTAVGGIPPYDFRVKTGSGTVVVTGESTGFYTAPGSQGLEILELIDSTGAAVEARVNVLTPQALVIYPTDVWVNTGGTVSFTALGGTPTYTYSVPFGTGSFPVPTSGLYQAPGGADTSTVRVTDSLSITSDATVHVVSSGALGINPATASVAEGQTYQFNAYGGTPGYLFSIVVGGTGTVNSVSGLYNPASGLPGETATIRVTDTIPNSQAASVTIVPAKPTNLVADGTFPGPQDIRLTWADNSAGEDGYKIERKTGGGAFVAIFTTGPGVTQYDDLGLAPNTPYTYRVRAYKGVLYSDYSNWAFDISNS